MAATAPARYAPTPGPVAPPDTGGPTGDYVGPELHPAPAFRYSPGLIARIDQAAPPLSQEAGDWLIWGIGAEFVTYLFTEGLFGLLVVNAVVLLATILIQLAHRERTKRARIAARNRKGTPSWAS